MAEVIVNPGICGFKSTITVVTEDMQMANVEISTECPNIKQMENELKDIDCLGECFSKIGTSRVYKVAEKYCKHIACPVPAAIIKGLEVACGLALPKDVEIKINM
ncbi:MAG: hypothetical protein PWP27_753 [Clostridiales bacterium]|nr:hypothetical protein [Clostridiales bacterium]MDK2932943.1 hypothetical protein [Clostridiales bacterium]